MRQRKFSTLLLVMFIMSFLFIIQANAAVQNSVIVDRTAVSESENKQFYKYLKIEPSNIAVSLSKESTTPDRVVQDDESSDENSNNSTITTNESSPNTDNDISYIAYIVVAIIQVVGILVLIILRRREKKAEIVTENCTQNSEP